ncbi:hypothetical protein [Roseicella sp. DB1501]|uniref:hypothetical protein n=1 Tax=Roseicella sp. DB1501 TaxID=2730925 RepID=UPI0014918B63|nr:hypothetical protein [Roseicella sp. DB1501]
MTWMYQDDPWDGGLPDYGCRLVGTADPVCEPESLAEPEAAAEASADPTPEQISAVQANLKAIQAFNDYLYPQGQTKIDNAYLLLSESDNRDPGLGIGLDIIEGAFSALGGGFGTAGAFAATFVSGMVASWTTSTPASLNTTFSDLLTRMQDTFLAVDQQLTEYIDDVAGNWNTSFSFNGQTATLSDLADIDFPIEQDSTFFPMMDAAIHGFDQNTWEYVLTTDFKVTAWVPAPPEPPLAGKESDPPIAYAQEVIEKHPAYYVTWSWVQGTGWLSQSGWDTFQFSLGGPATALHDAAISKDAAAYLFIDSTDGVTINPDGLFARKTVFTELGIPTETVYTQG